MIVILSRRLVGAVTLAAIVLASGCQTVPESSRHDETSHREGAVSYSKLSASADEQYKLTQTQHAFGAQPIEHDAPVYPASLIGKALPATSIRVKAIIDDTGHVTDVRDLEPSTDADRQALFNACRAAVMTWTYSPMTIVQESDDGHGNISQVRKNAAFSLDYAFRFEIVDGKPRVTTPE